MTRCLRVMKRAREGWGLILIFIPLFSGCSALGSVPALTPLSTDLLPTFIALTVEAAQPILLTQQAQVTPEFSPTISPMVTSSSTPLPTATSLPPTSYVPPTPTIPPIPDSVIQILNLGHLSRVASPVSIYSYLKPGYGNNATLEVRGEDNRILVRQVVDLPWTDRVGFATLFTKVPFEIPGTAEKGTLVLSTQDEFGRMTAINSISLILLSIGEADINPSIRVEDPIYIQQPTSKSLIQGGNLITMGIAHPDGGQYLMAQLIAEDGKIVGKRIAGLEIQPGTGYASFLFDIPYTVTAATPALLTIWEGEDGFSNIIHLSTVDVLLSP
jgi:hypothetical protein